jgi:hypothetical protein
MAVDFPPGNRIFIKELSGEFLGAGSRIKCGMTAGSVSRILTRTAANDSPMNICDTAIDTGADSAHPKMHHTGI